MIPIAGIFVLMLLGGSWWLLGKPFRDRDATLHAGYRSLILGMVTWGSVPWLVMGAGFLLGGVSSVEHYLKPQTFGPFVLAWFFSVISIWAAGTYWILFRRGAEQVAKHPGLLPPQLNARGVKIVWLLLVALSVMSLLLTCFADLDFGGGRGG